MREEFWKKLKDDDRSFKWFHKNYLNGVNWHNNTLYQQAKGDILTTMCDELENAIKKYIGS